MNEYLKRSIVYVTNKETNPSPCENALQETQELCILTYHQAIKTVNKDVIIIVATLYVI